ncbi:MAG: pyridoxamine 5'-phosphate oxidase family protein, partial [Prochlorothrix sp.]
MTTPPSSPISTIVPWTARLHRSLHHNRAQPQSRFVQLATVDPQGRPHCRTIVFRGLWQPDSSQPQHLQFVSDRRSEKILHLGQMAWVEVCWYFAKSREQFRFSGEMAIVTEHSPDERLQTQRHHLWHNLSDAARLQFAWPPPAQPRSAAAAFSPPAPDPRQPLDTFYLLLLAPQRVDY